MVFEEIEKFSACGMSLQRWKVLQEILVLGAEGNENCAKTRKFLALNGILLTVTPWPSDIEEEVLDFSQFLVGDMEEN